MHRIFLSQKSLLTAEGQRISELAETRGLAAVRFATDGSQPSTHARVIIGDAVSMQAHCAVGGCWIVVGLSDVGGWRFLFY